MDKVAVYIHNWILFSHTLEWNNAICINMDGPRDYHTKSDREKANIICYHLHVESKKKKRYKGTYLQNWNRLTDFENKLMVKKEKIWVERNILGVWGQHIHTTVYKT